MHALGRLRESNVIQIQPVSTVRKVCSYGNEVLTVAGKGVVEEQLLEKRRGCAGVNVWGHNVVALNGKPSLHGRIDSDVE